MSNVTIVALGALLGAVLLMVVAALLWQESRRRPGRDPTEFVIDDAVDHISAHLDEGRHVARPVVLEIVEWHMQWVTEEIRAGQTPVLGVTDGALNYILDKEPDLDEGDVTAVLDGVTGYLASIGVVGRAF